MTNRGRRSPWVAALAALLWLIASGSPREALASEPFSFREIETLGQMRIALETRFSRGATRETVRAELVENGGARLVVHPKHDDVEKYLYDINLCGFYVWRWNISADYTASGALNQIYVNAEPVLNGTKPAGAPKRGPYYLWAVDRPQAFKGERTLTASIAKKGYSPDARLLLAVGPTRRDPLAMGNMHTYSGEVWRSIFDPDDAGLVHAYPGDCGAVDKGLRARINAADPAARETLAWLAAPLFEGAKVTEPPTTIDDPAVRDWIDRNLKTQGWTLIAADDHAVVLGGPGGVKRLDDGTLVTDIRHEYYRPLDFEGFASRSNIYSLEVDCPARRTRRPTMAIFEFNNLQGASRGFGRRNATWIAVEPNSTSARTLARVCEAPTTGQLLR